MLTILHSLKRAQNRAPQVLAQAYKTKPQQHSFQMARGLNCQSFSTSQVTLDYRKAMKSEVPTHVLKPLSKKSHLRSDTIKVPDYQVSSERLQLSLKSRPDTFKQSEHPVETMAKATRAMNCSYRNLASNEVLITNLPTVKTRELKHEQAVREFLVESVHKDLQVKDVKFVNAISAQNFPLKTAYIKVVLGSKRQAQMVKTNLRKTWLHDSLLKIKTQEDVKGEAFDNRTVIVNGIPKHMRAEVVLEKFFAKDSGAVVGIELPQENSKLRDLRHEVAQREDQPASIEKEIQRRRALITVDESLKAEESHMSQVDSEAVTFDALKGDQGRKLELEKTNGVLRLITQLQAEGHSVLEQRVALLEIKESAQAVSSIGQQEALEALIPENKLRDTIEANQAQVERSLDYLSQNNEEIVNFKSQIDPLSELMRLGKEELAVAYDRLIVALEDREVAIESRLKKSIEHYGLKERILMQGKDFTKELEDVPNVDRGFNGGFKPEDIISVGQQVRNVINDKNVSSEDKVMQLLTQTLNPFSTNLNFNEHQLKNTTNRSVREHKVPTVPDPRIPRSLQKLLYKGGDFIPVFQEAVDKIIEEQRENMDMPFDELYHKQKKVIQDVIDAEKALEEKIQSLPDPSDLYKLDTNKLTAEQRGEVASILDRFQSPFSVSQNRKKEALLDEKLKQIQDGSHTGAYKFDYSETADLKAKLAQGSMFSLKQERQISQLLEEGQEMNMGYAFVTFSHADEARLFMLENANPYYGLDPIEIMLKSKLDHSTMDMQYFMAQARNEAKTIDELVAVREARQRLRSFEKEMDSQLPSRKRLQKARRFAASLVEDHDYMMKREDSFGQPLRTPLEKERLDRKVAAFEAEHPDIDLTAIYENDKTEAVRQTLHKKAYASYKAFHFLKNGVKRGNDLLPESGSMHEKESSLSSAKKRLIDNDPYNYPALDRTVRSVLSSEIDIPMINDAGDTITTPGRRNGYTEAEYIQAYFGKDMARRIQTESLDDPLYINQKSFKEKYPLDGFLKKPGFLEREAGLESIGLNYDPAQLPDLVPKNKDLAEYLRHRTEDDHIIQKDNSAIAADFDNILKRHQKDQKKYHNLKSGHFEPKVDMKYLGKQLKGLNWAYEKGEFEEKKDWFEMMNDMKVYSESTDQRFQEQEDDGLENYMNKVFGDTDKKKPRGPREDSGPREDAQEGTTTVEVDTAADELKDAKYEPEYSGENTEVSSPRQNRNQRNNENKPASTSSDNKPAKDGLSGIRGELASLRKGGDDHLVISSDGIVGEDAPDIITEKQHRIGSMMAKLNPEERNKLQDLYRNERIDQLENLIKLSEVEQADGSFIDHETINYLANDSEKKMQKVSSEIRQDPFTPLQRRVQSEAAYHENALKQKGRDINYILDEDEREESADLKQQSLLNIEKRKRAFEKDNIKQESKQRFSGAWFKKYQTQADRLEEDTDASKQKSSSGGKMLDEFISGASVGDQADLQDDDDDIYRQYQDMTSRSGDSRSRKNDEDFRGFKADVDELRPEMPRFDEYFAAEADGVHPFDKISNAGLSHDGVDNTEEQEAEVKREHELYQRELLGRLMGQRLSPSQYELVSGIYGNDNLINMRTLDTNNEEFLARRHEVRLLEEAAEKIRRTKVISGEWNESESQGKLQTYLEDLDEKYLSGPDLYQYRRDYKKMMQEMKSNESLHTKQEKEYHFDEGVGVSLTDHVTDLKARYPQAKIQTRRDRDGFAIVKLVFKPEYKYDLEEILAYDPVKAELNQAETLEALLKNKWPGGAADRLKGLNAGSIQQGTRILTGLEEPASMQNLSYEDRLAINTLTQERVSGRFKDDVAGFMLELEKLSKTIKPIENPKNVVKNKNQVGDLPGILEDLFDDRERFRDEISRQLKMKMQDHMFGKKRTASDFVKSKFNEAAEVAKVSQHVDAMQQKVEDGEGNSGDADFDREAFDELKRQLSMQKKLKEDMLTGTLPRFKAYLRI